MKGKLRLSASVDAELLRAAEAAAKQGRAPTVSAWVNEALRLKLAHDQRLQALAVFVEAYEAQHGEISPDEIQAARRAARARALPVRKVATTGKASSPRGRRRAS
jgi:hypothetical protein